MKWRIIKKRKKRHKGRLGREEVVRREEEEKEGRKT